MSSQPFDRTTVILSGLDLRALRGLEIGPLFSPLARRPEARVEYLDHLDTEGLRAKYRDDPDVAVDEIVEVDHVLDGRRLAQIVGETRYDYVIASHVIEHVPDVIGWLGEIEEILAPGGTLRLAIPDRRFTFDYLRRESELSDVLTAHVLELKRPAPIQIVDYTLNFRIVPLPEAWAGTLSLDLIDTEAMALACSQVADTLAHGTYLDVHCWVFTPSSFGRLMQQLATLGLVRFGCRSFVHTPQGHLEFYVAAEPMSTPEEAAKSWAVMAEEAEAVQDLPDPGGVRERIAELEQQLQRVRADRAVIEGSGSYRLARRIVRPMRVVRSRVAAPRRRRG